MRLIFTLLATLLAPVFGAQVALAAGGPYSPVILVNEQAVTQFELDQRIKFLTLLRVPGDPQAEAMKGLIEDRLRSEAAKRAGITLTDAQIRAMEEQWEEVTIPQPSPAPTSAPRPGLSPAGRGHRMEAGGARVTRRVPNRG